MPSQSIEVKYKGALHERIVDEIRARVLFAENRLGGFHKKWKDAEERALAYLPERETDKLRRAEREGGLPQYTTIQIPYSYAVMMASHTYWVSVFLGRTPIFQVDGRHGETQQQVQAMEALLAYQVQIGNNIPKLYTWLYDVGKYGIGIVGAKWVENRARVPRLEVREELLGESRIPAGRKVREIVTTDVVTFVGNELFNVSPYDFLWDPRVTAGNFQKGEFCIRRIRPLWNEIKVRQASGFYVNVERLKAGSRTFSVDGSSQLERPEDGSLSGVFPSKLDSALQKLAREHPDQIDAYEAIVEVIPSEWGLGDSGMPEKWVFTVTSDFEVVLGAQPYDAFHGRFPYSVLEIEPEGYGLIGRGIPEILEPVQNTMDWLLNSHFYNVRATLNNQFVVDPLRVVMQDLDDPLPGGVIRLRPNAQGVTDVGTVIKQLPVADVTQGHVRDMQAMLAIGERVMGVNDQLLGVLATGGRKTATEVRQSTGFGVGRLKAISEYMSAAGFAPLNSLLVANTQQNYNLEMMFKIAGDAVDAAGERFIRVTPDAIAGFFDFVPVDGTLPIDRFAQANLWKELFLTASKIPAIGQRYDLGGIFEWIAQLGGLKNISQFRTQIVPDEQLATQAAAGNAVPLNGAGQAAGSGPNADLARVPTQQVPGLGPTG